MELVSDGITASKQNLAFQAVQTLLMGKEHQHWCQNKQMNRTEMYLGKTLQTKYVLQGHAGASVCKCTRTSITEKSNAPLLRFKSY